MNKIKFNNVSNKYCIFMIIFGEIITCVEYLISRVALDFYIGTIITAVFVFIFAINNPMKYFNKLIEYIGNKLSMYIYVIHLMIINFDERTSQILGYSNNIIYSYSRPIIVIILCIITAFVISKVVDMVKYFLDKRGMKKIEN